MIGAGTANLFVPLNSLAAMAQGAAGRKHWGENGGPCLYLYTRESRSRGLALPRAHVRGGLGRLRGPGDGQRRGGFRGRDDGVRKARDGEHVVTIEQGVEMGRPSFISLGLDVEDGVLRGATIGGSAVIVCEGTIDL